jgi:hypothetical protein
MSAFHKVTEQIYRPAGAGAGTGGGYGAGPDEPNQDTSRDDTIDGEYYEQQP